MGEVDGVNHIRWPKVRELMRQDAGTSLTMVQKASKSIARLEKEGPRQVAMELYGAMRSDRINSLRELLEQFGKKRFKPKTFLRGYITVLIQQSLQLESVAGQTLKPELIGSRAFLQEYVNVTKAQATLLREIRSTIRDLEKIPGRGNRLSKKGKGLLDKLAGM